MLVYGDPSYEATLADLLRALRGALDAARAAPPGTVAATDQLRGLLILAGQVEQAAEDGLADDPGGVLPALRAATEQAATAFDACLDGGAAGDRAALVAAALERAAGALDDCRVAAHTLLTVKLPEGFACYALYPEQYRAAARRWLVDHAAAKPRRAVVVGLRSIGCALSALVAATLAAGGWEVRRLTVRPTGHPYAREVALAPAACAGATFGLVVDEGPGYSGSSMAAAAQALVYAGLPAERISFFPGHAGEPGAAASAAVRAWWRRITRYVTPPGELRVAGRSLPAALADATLQLTGQRGAVLAVEDLGGGSWRQLVYPSHERWPAVGAAFERPKYRCTLENGQRFLWKFGGLAWVPGEARGALLSGAAAEATRLDGRSRAGWSPSPFAVAHGFMATPWLDGAPLTGADADAATIVHLGRYLASSAGPPIDGREQAAALERLRMILQVNARELLGNAAADLALRLGEAVGAANTPIPASGDGRLAPHEWLRTPNGGLWKLDAGGHAWDHTPVGRQAQPWDVAGALVEWGLAEPAAAALLAAFRQAGGVTPSRAALAFYRAAYAAYRAGQCRWCADAAADAAERGRLAAAAQRYTAALARLLA